MMTTMRGALTKWAWVTACLLCAIMVCLAVHSPHCDVCDAPYFLASSLPQPSVNAPLAAAPDLCNGVCACCGFHGFPNVDFSLRLSHVVIATVLPDLLSPVPIPRPAPFRPPRMAISS